MIAHLDGLVCGIAPEGAVIEVGGVGLLVQCTPGTLATLRTGQRARVATSLVVREDALTLYGFASDDERDVFELVQTASGVGPRLALALLASVQPGRSAPGHRGRGRDRADPGARHRPKGAQRIVLELAGTARLARRLPSGRQRTPAAGRTAGVAAPGGIRSGPGWSTWAGRPGDADQAIAAVERDLAAAAPWHRTGRRGRGPGLARRTSGPGRA